MLAPAGLLKAARKWDKGMLATTYVPRCQGGLITLKEWFKAQRTALQATKRAARTASPKNETGGA